MVEDSGHGICRVTVAGISAGLQTVPRLLYSHGASLSPHPLQGCGERPAWETTSPPPTEQGRNETRVRPGVGKPLATPTTGVWREAARETTSIDNIPPLLRRYKGLVIKLECVLGTGLGFSYSLLAHSTAS